MVKGEFSMSKKIKLRTNLRDENTEIKSVEGKPYNPENGRKMFYGGLVNAKGIIIEAYTKEEYEEIIPRCDGWCCSPR